MLEKVIYKLCFYIFFRAANDVLQSVYVMPKNGVKNLKEEEYDPYKNRVVKHPTS